MNLRNLLIAPFVALGITGCATPPPTPATLRVNVFPGASNLPLFIGIDQGIFARHGLTIEIINTPNSDQQRAGLAKGLFEIAQAAVDNAVAMVEVAKEDVIIVAGGDGSMNEFMVRPEIKSIADIRGKTLVVDAPNTAYALVARKILKNNGLADGRDYKLDPVGGTPLRINALASQPENAAGMLNPPWSFIAESRGMRSIGRQIDLFGPYQSSGTFVMRKWALGNADVLERYLAGLIEASRVAMNPANRALAIASLTTRLKLEPKIAERTVDALMVPRSGLSPDARFDPEGFRNVLSLRAEMEGQWGGKPPGSEKFVDLSYYDRALKRIPRY